MGLAVTPPFFGRNGEEKMTDQEQLRVLIADDDAGMRTVMRKIIAKVEGFTLVAEAGDGKTTLELTEQLKPNVVFLDVEMPQMSGVECARAIQDMDPSIVIIFATAHDTYMGDAFEVYAFDYLVKPFKVDRVIQTLERARDRLLRRDARPWARPVPAVPRAAEGRLMLRHREGVSFIDLQDIMLVQREDRATRALHGGRGTLRHRDSLAEWRSACTSDAFSAAISPISSTSIISRTSRPMDAGPMWCAWKHQARRTHHPRKIRGAGADVPLTPYSEYRMPPSTPAPPLPRWDRV